ncbi:MAG: adenylate/guanylate cyclase domain-containing protein [Treponema sp.]|nr:adenylate/guanylate cyclase domain-containing protein [Treponema sp.]
MAKNKKIEKPITALIITILVFLVIMGLHLLGTFHFLEYLTYDVRVRFWADTSFSRASDEIVVILVNQESLNWAQRERGWGWPWPRQAYAEVIDYMSASGAKSVAFDLVFSEPSVYRNAKQDEIIDNAVRALETVETVSPEQPRADRTEGTGNRPSRTGSADSQRSVNRIVIDALRSLSTWEDDAAFIRASKDYSQVVQTVMFSSRSGNEQFWLSDLNTPLFQTENFGELLNKFSVGNTELALYPIKGLRDAAGALGSVTGVPDSDGVIRRLRPFTLFDGKAVPGLSSASLVVSGKNLQINYDKKNNLINWDGISIPVDKDGNAILRYRGQIERYIPYNASNILLSAEAYLNNDKEYMSSDLFLTPDNFKDTYVFLGVYAEGLYDIFNTPIAAFYPGMGCHITMLDNMLQNDFIRESSETLNTLILFAVIVLIICLTMFSNRITISVSGMILIIALIIAGAFLSYQFAGLWVPMITYIAGTLAAFVTVTLYNYATEGSQKRFIKSAFSQYLSPKVVDQLILDPSQLKLGGEKREMTAIFTDIRAFSTFSEALGDPAKLVELLNFYLTRMSNIVLDNQGTIDKYEGDAIIAFFGAPLHMKNHAALACRATVKMKKAEKAINREALLHGLITPEVMTAMAKKGIITSTNDLSPIFTRIGVNTGDMVVGNMGTPNKMDYTIMGNAVNLAARLEGVNKQYDTGGILISEYTRAQIGDEFIVRPLSRVRVVGVNTPIRLYELLDIAREANPEMVEMVKEWEQAFNLYEKKEFAAAKKIFQSIIGKNIGCFDHADNTAKKYLKRCEDFILSPPDDKKWDDGVDNLTEK